MAKFSSETPINPRQMAQNCRLLGWIGFWSQTALAVVTIVIGVWLLLRPGPSSSYTLNINTVLGYACLIALIFTLYWSYRYTRLAIDLEHPDFRPSRARVSRAFWIGLMANTVGMGFAVLIGLAQVSRMLFTMLTLPAGASRLITPTEGGSLLGPSGLFSAMDMLGLQAVMNAIAAELIGIVIAAWLLSRIYRT